ncbi:hypothetical protein TICRE_03120 [Tissierella creatinophila DSM 6911]|uniref:Uncharacterized protein n=1 Tax=Tissierella creatinophila DSM 6911 TaxID=1123403 RepID=A0A1U7M8U3_TISCR|nr:hypothetical protein TICRE_03120 [Tissierella creatinophila DSM 6911]
MINRKEKKIKNWGIERDISYKDFLNMIIASKT